MIELFNIEKTFNSGRQNQFTAIKGVNLKIEFNKITVIKGPSGSGKTTLASIIVCMSRPTSGRIKIGDRETTSLPERFLAEIRSENFGFIFQKFQHCLAEIGFIAVTPGEILKYFQLIKKMICVLG